MSAQMESGQVLDTDQVNALVALIKLGRKDCTYEEINNAIATGILDES